MDLDRFDRIAQSIARSPRISRRVVGCGLTALLLTLDAGAGAAKQSSGGGRRPRSGAGHASNPGNGQPPRSTQRRGRKPDPCKANFASSKDRNFCRFIRRQCAQKTDQPFCIIEGDPADPAKVAVCCAVGASCCGDACCPSDQCCSGVCTRTDEDSANCGSCGHACAAGQTCQGGQCVDTNGCPPNGCTDGQVCCNGSCC